MAFDNEGEQRIMVGMVRRIRSKRKKEKGAGDVRGGDIPDIALRLTSFIHPHALPLVMTRKSQANEKRKPPAKAEVGVKSHQRVILADHPREGFAHHVQ